MAELATDQASGLRRVGNTSPVRVVAVTSGKGGVGKTNVSVNISVALARAGQRAMLLDADLGMANVDVLLGLQPPFNLSHVLDGTRELEEIIVDGPDGLLIVPAASGISKMAGLGSMEHMGMINAFSTVGRHLDVLIVDTAAGISDAVTTFSAAADDVVLVVCDEPASITDAYALVKVLNREQKINNFQVLANMVRSAQEGLLLYRKLATVCERFLDVGLRFLGSVPHDEMLRKAVQKQRPVVCAYPGSMSAKAFQKMAHSMAKWPPPRINGGGLGFFIERMVND